MAIISELIQYTRLAWSLRDFLRGTITLEQSKQVIADRLRNRESNFLSLVQRGIYRYIRHPQHLGIIVMTLPFTLYIPWINDFGIRVGDLVTWICFTLLLVIYSDIEEFRLKKRFPKEFSVYQAKTGFIFPKIVQLDQFRWLKRIKENYFLKYTILVVVFISFILILQFIVETLMNAGILIAFK